MVGSWELATLGNQNALVVVLKVAPGVVPVAVVQKAVQTAEVQRVGVQKLGALGFQLPADWWNKF